MTLVDAGPLIALIDTGDPLHGACLDASRRLRMTQMATTWPCFAEAMYLLGSVGGYRYQDRLWRIRRDGKIEIIETTPAEADRMDALMSQFQNVPMDLADASLVAVAETRGFRSLFTIDSDFYIYTLADGTVLDVIH
jgi:predicted nucleic acid-binding protein